MQKLFERMCDIARGAALITGTTVDIKQVAAYSDLINNETLNDLIQENLERVIPIGYTEEELDYARKFQSVITELDKEGLKAIAADIGGRDRKKGASGNASLGFHRRPEQPVWREGWPPFDVET